MAVTPQRPGMHCYSCLGKGQPTHGASGLGHACCGRECVCVLVVVAEEEVDSYEVMAVVV